LIVWPEEGYRTELVYQLGAGNPSIAAEVRGEPAKLPPRVLDARHLFFREQSVG
jgi:hypothetical protein